MLAGSICVSVRSTNSRPDLLGEGADEVGFLDHAEVDQHAAERLRGLLMLFECRVELFGRDEAELDQDLPELLRLPLHGRHRRSVRSRSAAGWISQMELPACVVILLGDLKQPGELFRQEDPVDLRLVFLASCRRPLRGRSAGGRARLGLRRARGDPPSAAFDGSAARALVRWRETSDVTIIGSGSPRSAAPACAGRCGACPTGPREHRGAASSLGRAHAPARRP